MDYGQRPVAKRRDGGVFVIQTFWVGNEGGRLFDSSGLSRLGSYKNTAQGEVYDAVRMGVGTKVLYGVALEVGPLAREVALARKFATESKEITPFGITEII